MDYSFRKLGCAESRVDVEGTLAKLEHRLTAFFKKFGQTSSMYVPAEKETSRNARFQRKERSA